MGLLYSNNSNSVRINAVSGTIVKSFDKSFFYRCHINSYANEHLSGQEPYINSGNVYDQKKVYVVVLQCMLCGDGEIMYELIAKENWESLVNESRVTE